MQHLIVTIADGRKQRTFEESTKVLVDVFRSTSTIPILLKNGAIEIIPTGSISEARKLKKESPESILIGERLGFKVPGFDYGNSPTEIDNIDLKGKTVIFTSTNGTKVLKKIIGTGSIFISSFVNVSATVEALKNEEKVTIVVSNRPDGKADEDYIYAEYLKKVLLGENPGIREYIEKERKSSGSKRLAVIGFREDIEYSLRPDVVSFAVVYENGKIIRYR